MPIIPTPEKCLVCGRPYHATYDTFPLCKECFLIAEELHPLLKAYSALTTFARYRCHYPEIAAEIDKIAKDLKAVIEDFAEREKSRLISR